MPLATPGKIALAHTVLARGAFTGAQHPTQGTATALRLPDGRVLLTLTRFATSAGPDLRVRLDGRDLGALEGNRGDQQYALASRLDPAGRSVVIWCRAFSAEFGGARLARP